MGPGLPSGNLFAARAHRERLRDRPCDAAATSDDRPPTRESGSARCQCLNDEQPRAVLRSRRSERVERRDTTTEETPRWLTCTGCDVGSAAANYDVAPIFTCEWCFGPLEVAYDYDAIARVRLAGDDRGGPDVDLALRPPAARRPAERPRAPRSASRRSCAPTASPPSSASVSCGSRTTPATPRTRSRTGSSPVALSKALEFGFKTAACASTGNLANAVAAAAARAGLRSFVFIPSDLEQGKILTTAVYGGNVVAIDGNYDDVNRLCAELAADLPWAFVNVNVRPFYAEGSKTLAFETAEQLGWETPDHVVVPIASGSLLTKIRKGFDELHKVGLLDESAERACVRRAGRGLLAGRAPRSRSSTDVVQPVKPDTIAKSLAIGNPADGYFALDAVRETGGGIAAVTDDEIVEGMRLLARTEGIFGETAAGVTIATLKQARRATASSGPTSVSSCTSPATG